MDETSVLIQTVEEAVLNQGDHNVLCQALHADVDTPAHMVTVARGSKPQTMLFPDLKQAVVGFGL